MDVLIAAVEDRLANLNSALKKTIEEADPASLDWTPGTDANSLTVLLMHGLGAEEFLVATAVGAEVPRDREAEFRAAGISKDVLLARLEQVDGRVRDWLSKATPSDMAAIRSFRGRQLSGALCIVNAVAHVAEHLGHAQLTYQLWTQSRG